jgi:hypothetical protein
MKVLLLQHSVDRETRVPLYSLKWELRPRNKKLSTPTDSVAVVAGGERQIQLYVEKQSSAGIGLMWVPLHSMKRKPRPRN